MLTKTGVHEKKGRKKIRGRIVGCERQAHKAAILERRKKISTEQQRNCAIHPLIAFVQGEF